MRRATWKHHQQVVYLVDPDADPDLPEVELEVEAFYFVHPAEPDVGYPHDYTELEFVATVIPPFGQVIFHLEPYFEEKVVEELTIEPFEDV